MRRNRVLIISFLVVLSCFTKQGFSQEDISKYFDDGDISTATKLIKIGFDPLNGEIPLSFEHRITRHISLEWGVGLVSMEWQTKLYQNNPLPDLPDSGYGYNCWVNMRIYLKGYYERFYVGFMPKINFLDGKTYTDYIAFSGGYQFPISGHLVFDVNAGMGVRCFKYTEMIASQAYKYKDSRFAFPVQLKIGYAF